MKKIIYILTIIILIRSNNTYAFERFTHEQLNLEVSNETFTTETGFNLNDVLKNKLNFQEGIYEPLGIKFSTRNLYFYEASALTYITDGGRTEDIIARSLMHFHDPYTNEGLGGTSDSAILWAQQPGQGYSWPDAREYYYKGLTSLLGEEKAYEFSLTFRSLGQLMHLVEDMAAPEHTRNDKHPLSPGIELFLENTFSKTPIMFDSFLKSPIFFDFKTLQTNPSSFSNEGAHIPIANIFDTNAYIGIDPDVTVANTSGLSEYSNANFFSTDTNTVDSPEIYPYPNLLSTYIKEFDIESPVFPGQTMKRIYFVKNKDGETNGIDGYKLSAVDVFTYYYEINIGTGLPEWACLPLLDDYVLEDYSKLLLPRALGYASSLLNYFFRGEVEISLPERGIYALAVSDSNGFNDIRLKVQNKTLNDEQMPLGTIELVVKYKIAQQDPFQGVPVTVSPEFRYAVIPEKNGITNIPSDHAIELAFDLSGREIPFWATDLSFQIVYRGQLGYPSPDGFIGEEDGIAVGYKDVSEPTIISYINGMDVACLNDKILVAGSEEALNELDENGDKISSYIDVYPHLLTNSFLKFSPQNNISYASATNYEASIPELYPGHYGQMFIIAEPYGTFELLSNQTNLEGIDSADTFFHWPQTATRFFQGMINQTEYENDKWIQYYSGLTDLRGIKTWAGIFWTNLDYPADTTCYEGNSTVPLTGPDSIELKL